MHPYLALGLEVLVSAAVVEVLSHHTKYGLMYIGVSHSDETGDRIQGTLLSWGLVAVGIAIPAVLFHLFVWKKYTHSE